MRTRAIAGGQVCDLPTAYAVSDDDQNPTCVTTANFATYTAAYTADGDLVTGGLDGQVRLWQDALPQTAGTLAGSGNWAVSPDYRTLASSMNATSGLTDSVGIWSITPSSTLLPDYVLPVSAYVVEYVSPTVLLTVSSTSSVLLWNLANPHRPTRGVSLGTTEAEPVSMAGDLVAIEGSDHRVHLWRVLSATDATEIGSFAVPVMPGDYSPYITSDGHEAFDVVQNSDGVSTGMDWWNLSNPADPVPDGFTSLPGTEQYIGNSRVVAVEGNGGPNDDEVTIRLIAVGDGKHSAPVVVTRTAGTALALSPDGRILAATGAGNNTLGLWDVADPRHPVLLGTILAENQITGMTFDLADNQLAVWNNAGTLQLWNIANPRSPALTASIGSLESGVFTVGLDPEAPGGASPVAYLPGDQRLLVAEGNVYVLDTNPAGLAASLCSHAGDSLTAAQWEQYVPNIPFQNPCAPP